MAEDRRFAGKVKTCFGAKWEEVVTTASCDTVAQG